MKNEASELPSHKNDPELYSPSSSEDLLKMREQLRRRDIERWQTAALNFAENIATFRNAAINNSVEYGKSCVRMGVVLNGGAIIALLALLGSLFGKGDQGTIGVAISFGKSIYWAFMFYVGGLLSIALCAALAYVNWQYVAGSALSDAELLNFLNLQEMPERNSYDSHVRTTSAAAMVFGLASAVLFCAGSLIVANSFAVLGIN